LKPAARNWAIVRVHEVCTCASGYAATDTVLQAAFASPVARCAFACSACVIAFFASAMNSSSPAEMSSYAMGSPSAVEAARYAEIAAASRRAAPASSAPSLPRSVVSRYGCWMRLTAPPAGASHGVIGRDEEVAVLERFLDALEGAPGRLVLEGEAGIGKTVLFREAVCAAQVRGYRVLKARPGDHQFASKFIWFRFDSTGKFIGLQRVTRTMTLSTNLAIWSSNDVVEVLTPDGTVVATLHAVEAATRVGT
jgi:hypothetical protein